MCSNDVRENVRQRHEGAVNLNDVLNKPNFEMEEYFNFARIISKRGNWRNYFEDVFVEKAIFEYKMSCRIVYQKRHKARTAP